MNMDLFTVIGAPVKMAIQAIASATTTNSTGIDLHTSTYKTAEGVALLVITVDAVGGVCDVALQDSADDSTYAAIAAGAGGAQAIAQVASGSSSSSVLQIQLENVRRYIRISTITGAGTTSTEVHATIDFMKPGKR